MSFVVIMMVKYVFILACSLLSTSFALGYECDTKTHANQATTIAQKIYPLLQKHNITADRLQKKIEQSSHSSIISPERACLVRSLFLQMRTYEDQTSKDAIQSYDFLYPYYKTTYIPQKDASLLRHFIFQKDTDEKVVYLTFDDGPQNRNLLDTLTQKQIPATFFLLCSRMNSTSIQPYRSDLFSIGGHSVSHDNFDTLTKKQIQHDFATCAKVFANLSLPFRIFRPPYGIINQHEREVAQQHDLDIYIWNIDSLDWNKGFTKARIQHILDALQPGDILLFHEHVNLERLIELIEGIQKKGYRFGKL